MYRNSSNPTLISPNCSVSVIQGKLVEDVVQEFNPWPSQVIRLYRNNGDFVEFDWIVRPLPLEQDMEIITRFDAKVFSTLTLIMERKRDFRKTWNLKTGEKVTSNYYPITSWIFIRDLFNNLQLNILTDRP
jgi:hypothetical protein